MLVVSARCCCRYKLCRLRGKASYKIYLIAHNSVGDSKPSETIVVHTLSGSKGDGVAESDGSVDGSMCDSVDES